MNSRLGVTPPANLGFLLSELSALRAGSQASSCVHSTSRGQAHPATYRPGTPRLRFWISDLGFLATIEDIERNSSDFTIYSQSLTNFYANFQFAFRNPHSPIVYSVARPSSRSRHGNL